MDLILPDQPNRRIRTRKYGGVGGTLCEERSYPDIFFLDLFIVRPHAYNFDGS